MGDATQDYRSLGLQTKLGPDKLLIERITGHEGLSQPFEYRLQAIDQDDMVEFDKLLGTNATVRIEITDEGPTKTRFVNGIISQAAHIGHDGEGRPRHELVLVPWLWLLTRTSDCRIFQQMSVVEILEKIFGEEGFSDFERKLKASYETRDFCVQYSETDFNFVQRLMEEEGIYYFFEHENGKHKMVLCDEMGAHKPTPGFDKLVYRPKSTGVDVDPTLFSWKSRGLVTPGAVALNSFDFENPVPASTSRLIGKSVKANKHEWGGAEIYENSGEYATLKPGENMAKVRREEVQTNAKTVTGETAAVGLLTGAIFKLAEHPRSGEDGEYLVTNSSMAANSEGFTQGGGVAMHYSASFAGIPKGHVYRPPRTAEVPRIPGPQTAIVVGPSGEEIYTDEFGRVKVQFLWDRYGKGNEGSSCWIRVAQAWAGKQWGGFSLPRIGQEVIVEFLDGDPDRPIITGRVYNGDCMPPYELPANKTRTTFKSNSTPKGGGFNEIRIEDKKGKEQIFIHAEKDRDLRVKNDNKEIIQGEEHILVEKLRKEEVVKDNDLTIGGVNKEQIKKDSHLTVGGSLNEKIGESQSLKVGMNLQQKAGMKIAQQAGQEVHIKAGMNVVIEAGMSITLKAGGGFVVVGPAGVTISGTPVLINSGGAAGAGSGCSPTAPQKPKKPKKADKDKAGKVAKVKVKAGKPKKGKAPSATNVTLKKAAQSGAPFCEVCNQ